MEKFNRAPMLSSAELNPMTYIHYDIINNAIIFIHKLVIISTPGLTARAGSYVLERGVPLATGVPFPTVVEAGSGSVLVHTLFDGERSPWGLPLTTLPVSLGHLQGKDIVVGNEYIGANQTLLICCC